MAQTQNFSFYRGENIALDFQEADYSVTPPVPTDITGWTIQLTIRKWYGVLITKTATITIPATAGQFSFVLAHADTNFSSGAYAFDVQRVDAGHESCLALGVLTILQEVLY